MPREHFFKELVFTIRPETQAGRALGGLVSFCLCQPQTTPWVLGREPVCLIAVAAGCEVCISACVCVCSRASMCWAQVEGGVQALLICQPSWEQATHLASCSWLWGWGREEAVSLGCQAGLGPTASMPHPWPTRSPRSEIWGSFFRLPGVLSSVWG